MAILIDEHTRVVVQGVTGRIGRFHTEEMINYGTQVVAGVTPGKGGDTVLDRPVFNTMKDAVAQTGATASIVFVPPPFAADALMEAADAGIRFCACITDGIPMHDMLKVKRYMRRYRAQQKMTLTGPNCAGTISPGRSLLGIMPGHIYLPGRVGLISRSGTLGYEAASQMKALGIGVSTSVGIGGDPVNGTSFRDHLALFEADPDTDAVVMVGEIGGPQEVEGAEYVRQQMTKPVIAYIAGLSAPRGRKMGHAGAIVSGVGESAQEKIEILTAAGITVAPNPSCIGETVARVLAEHGLLDRSSEVGTSPAVGSSSRATNPPIDHLQQHPTRAI
jgi:malate-CoA ligase subunit alpha